MTNLKNIALIAALSAAPMVAFADSPVSGSPQQSVDADPNEYAPERDTVEQGSIGGTYTGSPAQSIEDDPNETALDLLEDTEGSIGGVLSGSPAQSIDNDPNEYSE